MFSTIVFFLALVSNVCATIYVTTPLDTTTCHGGQPCSVEWIDNGEAPLLSNIGPCYVGLYYGHGVLIQQIEAIDVGRVHFLSFTPNPSAGPNSHTYYINFTSIDPLYNTPGYYYTQYSPFFTLVDMTGSLSNPNPSDTSLLPVPSTVISPPPPSPTSTITISNTFTTTTATAIPVSSSLVSVSTSSASAATSDSPSPSASTSTATEPVSTLSTTSTASPSISSSTVPSSTSLALSESESASSSSAASPSSTATSASWSSVSGTALTILPSAASVSSFTTTRTVSASATNTPLNPTAGVSTSGASRLCEVSLGMGGVVVLALLVASVL